MKGTQGLVIFIGCVVFGSAQRLFTSDTISACLGDTLFLTINKNFSRNTSIRWVTPYASIFNTSRINATKSPGKYLIMVTENGKTIRDSVVVRFFPKPVFDLKDTTICWGKKYTPEVRINPQYVIRWSTGEKGNSISIRTPGIYWAEASKGGCRYRDSFQVSYVLSDEKILPNEVKFCISEENKIVMVSRPDPKMIYEWSNSGIGPSTLVNSEGMLYVKMFHPVCGYKKDSVMVKFKPCDCEILVPNSFSPNDDNRNDYFFPVLQCDYASYQITIFDKYGNVLFHSDNPLSRWDGKYKGVPCEEDIYVYKIETVERVGERKQVKSGRISLIR